MPSSTHPQPAEPVDAQDAAGVVGGRERHRQPPLATSSTSYSQAGQESPHDLGQPAGAAHDNVAAQDADLAPSSDRSAKCRASSWFTMLAGQQSSRAQGAPRATLHASMSDPVLLALIGVLGTGLSGLGGAYLGIRWKADRDEMHWHRGLRQDACNAFMRAVEELRAISYGGLHGTDSTTWGDLRPLRNAAIRDLRLTAPGVRLNCSDAAARAADQVVEAWSVLIPHGNGPASTDDAPRRAEREAYLRFMDAARKDLAIT